MRVQIHRFISTVAVATIIISSFVTRSTALHGQIAPQAATIDSLQRLIALAPHSTTDTTRVALWNALSGAFRDHNAQKSLLYADSVIVAAAQFPDRTQQQLWRMRAFTSKGVTFEQFSKYGEALQCYTQALAMARAVNKEHEQAEILSNIGTVYRKQNQYALGLEYSSQALALAQKIGDKRRVGIVLNTIGVIYKNQGQYDHARECYEKALRIAEELGQKTIQISVLNNIGVLEINQGQHITAIRALLKALAIAEQLANKTRQGSILNNIGNIYLDLSELPKALEYYTKALTLTKESDDLHLQRMALSNIGIVYNDQGNYVAALEAFHQSLMVNETPPNKRAQSLALGNMASALAALSLLDSAQHVGERSLSLALEVGTAKETASALVALSAVWASKKNYTQALSFAERAVRLADSVKLREKGLLHRPLEIAADAASALGQHERAVRLLQRLRMLNDSLYATESTKKVAQLQMRYEIEKREAHIGLLEKEKTLQEKELRWQQQQRGFLLACIVSIVICAGVLLYLYILKRNSERTVQQKNAELLAAHERIFHQKELLETQALELHAANAELRGTNERLQMLDKEKNEFLGIAAHDLKNPLANIMAQADIIHLYRGRMTEEQIASGLKRIVRTSERMREIITKFLEMNALEYGEMRLSFEPINVEQAVQDIIGAYSTRAEEKNLSLHFSTHLTTEVTTQAANRTDTQELLSSTEYWIQADTVALNSIIDNLVSNAVKYSPHGKNIWVSLSANPHRDCIRLEVQDEGQGITAEDMKQLFGKFARLSAKPTGSEHSTGLGLSIVKKLVEVLNGQIWCESSAGMGARFIVELPATTTLPVTSETVA